MVYQYAATATLGPVIGVPIRTCTSDGLRAKFAEDISWQTFSCLLTTKPPNTIVTIVSVVPKQMLSAAMMHVTWRYGACAVDTGLKQFFTIAAQPNDSINIRGWFVNDRRCRCSTVWCKHRLTLDVNYSRGEPPLYIRRFTTHSIEVNSARYKPRDIELPAHY